MDSKLETRRVFIKRIAIMSVGAASVLVFPLWNDKAELTKSSMSLSITATPKVKTNA